MCRFRNLIQYIFIFCQFTLSILISTTNYQIYYNTIFYTSRFHTSVKNLICVILNHLLFAHGQGFVSVLAHPLHPLPLHGKTQNTRGWRYPAPHLKGWDMRGSLDWFRVLPLLSFRWIWGSFPLIVYDVCHWQDTYQFYGRVQLYACYTLLFSV